MKIATVAMTDIALASPGNGTSEIAGPARRRLTEFERSIAYPGRQFAPWRSALQQLGPHVPKTELLGKRMGRG